MNTIKYILLYLLLACSICGCATNPITGQEELMLSPVEADFKMGHKFAPIIEEKLDDRIPDEALQRYIDRVGQHIAGICHRPDWEYHYIAVNHTSINALALPGGYIYITRGLLEKINSESQLAAILAHETAHVVARDTAAALARQTGMSLISMAALVTSATGNTPGEVAQLAIMTNQILTLSYSREDEKEADLAGLDYLVDAGYDPNGMVETMQVLQDQQTRRPIEFYSTHPLPISRIRYLKQRIRRRYADLPQGKTGKEEYKTRVRAYLDAHKAPPRNKRKTEQADQTKRLQPDHLDSGVRFRIRSSRPGTYIY